jgi:D-threonate/D-erythronate kinase
MLVVLADDFSGAAEIAGIAFRYGLASEVQLDFDATTKADLVVLDTDTRGLKEDEAIRKITAIAATLTNAGFRIFFKKIDSVLRGHLVSEINALQQTFQFDRVLIMPANPARGRKIIAGKYFVNDLSLEQTVFAKDPHFPTTIPSVEKIIARKTSLFTHVHLKPGDELPVSSLITGDILSKKDLMQYAEATSENDLCCGAAEFFEAFLESKGLKANAANTMVKRPPYTIIISGSTVKEQFERGLNKDIQHISLPGKWKEDVFVLEKEEEKAWQEEVSKLLEKYNVLCISITHEVKQVGISSELFSGYFVHLVKKIFKEHGSHIHFALTGGATASAIIRSTARHGLYVKNEIAPGIVTLTDQTTNTLYTVKPGSYLWPASFIQSLIN